MNDGFEIKDLIQNNFVNIQNSIKITEVVEPTKKYYKTFGTSEIKSPMSPPSLCYHLFVYFTRLGHINI